MDKITELIYKLTNEAGEIFITAGDKVLKFTVDTLSVDGKSIQPTETLNINKDINPNVTIVTGLWDMGRHNLSDGFKRSYEHYKQKFAELLKCPNNMFIYVSKEDEEFIWKHRSPDNTFVKVMELEEFKTWFEFYDKVQEIRTNTEWKSQAAWLEQSPQANLPDYNPLVMSKMFLLNNASIFNPFNSEYFYWIDAGITNTVHGGYFYKDFVFNNLEKFTNAIDSFLFISYPYEDGHEIHGFPRALIEKEANSSIKYVCRGGFFGGNKEQIHNINSLYYHILYSTLSRNLMGTEESVFTILSHLHPEQVHRFEINGDGLIWPFFEELKNVEQLITKLPPKPKTAKTAKNIIYVLGFNSTQQFESVVESIKNGDTDLFEKSKKILINNSTDTSMFAKYDELCTQYGFEEIHRENLGVCGGRQFAAEHFSETNADFYMFFEDDMHLNAKTFEPNVCRNGFPTYVPNLYEKVVNIMLKEKLDFLKFSFSEFYGDNSIQWSWYNVPQKIRTDVWPHYDKLPETGLDPNAPKTKFDTISYMDGTPYILGQVYYSNWPQIVSREGNQKMFLNTTWARPYEQTWMSHIFQLTLKDEIKSAILLASPIEHKRFEFYGAELRKES